MRQIPDTIGPLPDQPWVHPDRGYDSTPTQDLLDELGYVYEIARKGVPAPIQAGKRWVVERTHSWMNGDGKIRRCTEKRRSTVEFSLHLAATLTVIRRLINEARTRYRRPARPTTRRPQVTSILWEVWPGCTMFITLAMLFRSAGAYLVVAAFAAACTVGSRVVLMV